ncbi:retrovirus-related pol polyprotein from transposon TNT 1-94 [Tanacetum coccineum]
MSSECNNIKLAIRNDKSEFVYAMCKQCLITANHDVCVLNYVNGLNSCVSNQSANVSNTINQKKHKANVKKSKKLDSKERLSSPGPRKPRSCLRWSPTGRIFDHSGKIIKSSDFECFQNLFMVCRLGLLQAYDRESEAAHQLHLEVHGNYLEVAFRRNTCFVRNLDGVDMLEGSRTTNLYTINLHEMNSTSPICLMARATSTKSWLWHQRLSHLNFDTINELAKENLVTRLPKFKYSKDHLCPSCEQGKSKKLPHKLKLVPNSKKRLHLLHIDLCGPMRVKNINGKWYVLSLQPKDKEDHRDDESIYDDNIGGQSLDATRNAPAVLEPHNLLTPNASTTIADSASTPRNSSTEAPAIPNISQDVDELQQQQHAQQQDDQS